MTVLPRSLYPVSQRWVPPLIPSHMTSFFYVPLDAIFELTLFISLVPNETKNWYLICLKISERCLLIVFSRNKIMRLAIMIPWFHKNKVFQLHSVKLNKSSFDFKMEVHLQIIDFHLLKQVKSPEGVRRAVPANIVNSNGQSQSGPRPSMIPRRPKSLTSSIHTVQVKFYKTIYNCN